MERHRLKDAELSKRQSKNEHLKTLEAAKLARVSSAGEMGEGTYIKDDVKPGDTKRLVSVYGPPVPRKKVSTVKTTGPAKSKKESAGKSAGRPASPGRKKRPERSLS